MDKQAKKKHLKELKRKHIRRNIRIHGKQINKLVEIAKPPLEIEEFVKSLNFMR